MILTHKKIYHVIYHTLQLFVMNLEGYLALLGTNECTGTKLWFSTT